VGVESIGKVLTLPFIPSPHREGKIDPNLPFTKGGNLSYFPPLLKGERGGFGEREVPFNSSPYEGGGYR